MTKQLISMDKLPEGWHTSYTYEKGKDLVVGGMEFTIQTWAMIMGIPCDVLQDRVNRRADLETGFRIDSSRKAVRALILAEIKNSLAITPYIFLATHHDLSIEKVWTVLSDMDVKGTIDGLKVESNQTTIYSMPDTKLPRAFKKNLMKRHEEAREEVNAGNRLASGSEWLYERNRATNVQELRG